MKILRSEDLASVCGGFSFEEVGVAFWDKAFISPFADMYKEVASNHLKPYFGDFSSGVKTVLLGTILFGTVLVGSWLKSTVPSSS